MGFRGGDLEVGKRIDVGDVISRSTSILAERPAIILPQLIPVIPILFTYLAPSGSVFSPLEILASIASGVLTIIVSGAYPSIVKASLKGEQFSMTDALGRAYHKFWTLLVAGILVGLIVVLGLIALVVPGLIFAAWYAYTVPVIMLEDKGALDGMSASKTFGRNKKWSTFSMLLIIAVFNIAALVVETIFTLFSPLIGSLVYRLLTASVAAWSSVIFAYTYVSYGPSSVPAAAEIAFVSPSRYCTSCGGELRPADAFCPRCGQKAS